MNKHGFLPAALLALMIAAGCGGGDASPAISDAGTTTDGDVETEKEAETGGDSEAAETEASVVVCTDGNRIQFGDRNNYHFSGALDIRSYPLAELSDPLIDWSEREIWAYIRANEVPYNKLHDRGFPSIGCAPCTRAIQPGEDVRAGRWWWENPETKECGLHVVDGQLKRRTGS